MKKPSEENIKRLVSLKKGDPSFLLLATYSFIESYIRNSFPNKLITRHDNSFYRGKSKEEIKEIKNVLEKNKQFNTVLTTYRNHIVSSTYNTLLLKRLEQKKISRDKMTKEQLDEINADIYDEICKMEKYEPLITLLKDIEKYHNKYTNPIRHEFATIDPGIIYTGISRFIDFAKHENFCSKEIENLSDFKDWKELKPEERSEFQNKVAELLRKYEDSEIAKNEAILKYEREVRNNEILEAEKYKLQNEKQELKENYDSLSLKEFEYKKKLDKLQSSNDKNNNYEKEIKKLSEEIKVIRSQKEEQEKLVNQKQIEIDNLVTTSKTLAEQVQELTKSIEESQHKSINTQLEIESLKRIINDLEKNTNKDEKLINDLEKYKKSYKDLLELKNKQDSIILEKQNEIDQLNTSNISLSSLNDDLKVKLNEASKNLNDSKQKAEELQCKIRKLEENPIESEETKTELEKLHLDYKEIQKEKDELRKYINGIKYEYEIQVNALEEDTKELIENIKLMQIHAQAARNYHERILKLSPDQEKIVKYICSKITKTSEYENNVDYLIQGGPGTGKTLVLIKILENFAMKSRNADIKLLTYTKSLSNYNQYLSMQYEKKNKKSNKKVLETMNKNILTFDDFFKEKIFDITGKNIYFINRKISNYKNDKDYLSLKKIIASTVDEKYDSDDLDIIIDGLYDIWDYTPEKESFVIGSYLKDNPKSSEDDKNLRELIWDLYETQIKLEIEKQTNWPAEYSYWKIAQDDSYNKLQDKYKVNFLLIDEIQDLSPARIMLITKLAKISCVMAGDKNQSVFIKDGRSWFALWQKMTGKTTNVRTLYNNYRSTIPIQKLANLYRQECLIRDDSTVSEAFLQGQDPEFSHSTDIYSAIDKIVLKIKCYIEVMKYSPKDICVVFPTDAELDLLKNRLHDEHFIAEKIDVPDFEFDNNDTIRLSTTKYVKGIDSPVLILVLSDKFVDRNENGDTDPNAQMNSIYSCITRSMDQLYIQILDSALTTNLINNENSVTKLEKVWDQYKKELF